jgi:xanthine dehydrogenase accessory factor
MSSDNFVLLRGGGDLASGVALRLHRAGIRVVITELAQPLAVRRTVSFAEAVFEGTYEVEGVKAKLIEADQLSAWNEPDVIPVLIDPNADVLSKFSFPVVIDARLIKSPPSPLQTDVPFHIGLGPGFSAGSNCHAVIETRRSHTLGRVIWNGAPQPDSGQPEGDPGRVLRAPMDGVVIAHANIGEHLEEGQVIAEIQNDSRKLKVECPFDGVLRGLIRDEMTVIKGLKIGDVDPRGDKSACYLVSDKALAIGGGVLEAILSRSDIRKQVYS